MGSREQSPRDKYLHDPDYHHLVMTLEQMIHRAQFTPSELREAATLASINYELSHIPKLKLDPRTADALLVLDEWSATKRRRP